MTKTISERKSIGSPTPLTRLFELTKRKINGPFWRYCGRSDGLLTTAIKDSIVSNMGC